MSSFLKNISLAAGLWCALSTTVVAADQVTSVLKLDSGPVRGVDNGLLLSYLGVPYAAPPVGSLRWRPPQSPQLWTDVLDATRPGNACIQNADLGGFASAGGSEDCLYLNVHAPRAAAQAGKPLPVLFWIHGGALSVGQGSDYDPRKLALEGRAVVVTINYRLGMFGVFSHLAIDGEGHAFANYAQMDQSFALDWVQRNIAAFGGDPKNVTIAGESSGGTSVLTQMITPWSRGKFQHAINMSGSSLILKHPYFTAPVPLDVARKTGSEFAAAAGCADQTAECLRGLTAGQILAVQKPYMINQTIIDGDFMPMEPNEALRTGQFSPVTLVNGSTRDEGTFFVGFPENETGQPLTEEGYKAGLNALLGAEIASRALEEYPVADYESPSDAYATAVTDFLFSCPALTVAQWVSQKAPVYAYEFADRTAPSYLEPTTFPMGAAHTYELSYLFPGFNGGKLGPQVALNPLQDKLSDEMVEYWATVSEASNWNGWAKYDPASQNVLRFALPGSSVLPKGRFSETHRCEFWNKTGIY